MIKNNLNDSQFYDLLYPFMIVHNNTTKSHTVVVLLKFIISVTYLNMNVLLQCFTQVQLHVNVLLECLNTLYVHIFQIRIQEQIMRKRVW